MAKIIKVQNNKGSDDTWVGQVITNGSEYTLDPAQYSTWAADSKVLSDVSAANLGVSDGTSYFSTVSLALNWLTGTSSTTTQPVNLISPGKATYTAASGTFTPAATPTDLFTITGSATKVVKILKIMLYATQTTAGSNILYLNRYSTANTGGTSATPTIITLDTSNPAPTAVIRSYTANPTLGTLVGSHEVVRAFTPTLTTAGTLQPVVVWDYDTGSQGQPITLRATSEQISVNFAGAARPTGLSVACFVKFTEE